ncbi:MAG: GNAT family N-acetyltransferase [Streptosporangiaceae bacterium]
MSTVTAALFTCPLGGGAALLPRTAAMAEAYQALWEVNYERLARWFPGLDGPPTLAGTRAALEQQGQAWLDGSQLPLAIAVPAGGGWRLVGAVSLFIDDSARSAEVGYWIDGGFEGHGLVTRAVSTALDHAFGPLGLQRVELRTTPANQRSRRVAERLGFTQEGVLRSAAAFPGGRQDELVYGLLASEWPPAAHVRPGA